MTEPTTGPDTTPDTAEDQSGGLGRLKRRQRAQREQRRGTRRRKPEDPVVLTSTELAVPPSLVAATITGPAVAGPFAAEELPGHVVADRDAEEVVYPPNTTVGVTRVLWRKGDRVRRDIHDAFWTERTD